VLIGGPALRRYRQVNRSKLLESADEFTNATDFHPTLSPMPSGSTINSTTATEISKIYSQNEVSRSVENQSVSGVSSLAPYIPAV
jgi:hypothetical protein